MKISDLISMCFKNLTRRKVRTLLTVMGVVVGTCAIVVMISIGVGMKETQEQMLSQMGDLTMIEVYNYNSNNKNKLDDATLEKIQALEGVEIVTPLYSPNNLNLKLFTGKNDRYCMDLYEIIGVYPEAIEKLGFEVLEGNSFADTTLKYPVLFGEKTAYRFRDTKKRPGLDRVNPYPDQNGKLSDPFVKPMKDEMKLISSSAKENVKDKEYEINVVGVLKEDYAKAYQTSQGVFMRMSDIKKIEAEYRKMNGLKAEENSGNYQNVKVKTTDIKYVEAVQTFINDLGFDTSSLDSIRKPMEKQARQQQMILGSLGAISLFVAALGITNTMVMSIYERTREIGVMKVLGCFVNDIRTVFLMEAGSIGFLGGVIGIILSYIISAAMNYFGLSMSMGDMGMMGGGGGGGKVSIIPLWLVAFALIFATFIGLASGFYPANRAVKISALEAIKHD
ncbi:MAG: FtsX-like permease family protein [Oscillospiraceae bacterium]